MKPKKLVVEVGCGGYPWIVYRSLCLAPEGFVPVRTPIMDEYADVHSGDQFICIDRDASDIKEASKNVQKLAVSGELPVSLAVVDGRKLPFADASVDAVIMNNVFSAPTPGTRPSGSEPYPLETCISSEAKWQMVMEALRVLKKGGALVIGITMTPCYADVTMARIEKELVAEKKVTLLKQCGKFVPESDDWHLYHAVFQKEPGPAVTSVETAPWTPEQEEYIRKYAAQWAVGWY